MTRSSRAVGTVGLLVLSLMLAAVPSAQAQLGIGVQISCDDDPELNVHPSENADVDVTCTVKNTGQLESTISVDYEWQDDDPRVDMSLSEDEFTLAAGAEENFQATFSGSPRIEADLSLDFDITASISSVMVLPVDQLNQSATYSGEVTVQTFGMVDLTLTDRSTRNLEASEEVSIGFTMGNDGNAEDKIEVNIANLAELESAGFSFPEGSFVAETVMVEGTSAERTIVLRTPSDVAEEVRVQVVFEATSTNDATADPMQSTVTVVVQAAASNAALVVDWKNSAKTRSSSMVPLEAVWSSSSCSSLSSVASSAAPVALNLRTSWNWMNRRCPQPLQPRLLLQWPKRRPWTSSMACLTTSMTSILMVFDGPICSGHVPAFFTP